MKLTVKERLLFSGLYPKEGNLMEQVLIRDISKKVMFESNELKKIELKTEGNNMFYKWDEKKAIEKDIEFTDIEIDFLKNEVSKLDTENKITQDLLNICLKIRDYNRK